ncbi:unannotated protein [freshwater metagenome]|uniref:Unannotated protein n=1 Tax=freshwater metagenome TaxID=449393 RepID=A0A6J7NU94_9ZZZZ
MHVTGVLIDNAADDGVERIHALWVSGGDDLRQGLISGDVRHRRAQDPRHLTHTGGEQLIGPLRVRVVDRSINLELADDLLTDTRHVVCEHIPLARHDHGEVDHVCVEERRPLVGDVLAAR